MGRGLVSLECLSTDGPVSAALDAALATRGIRPIAYTSCERATLTRAEAATHLDNMRPHHRHELQQLGRRLGREVGPLRTVDRSDDPRAVEDFLKLESSGWKGRANTALACSSDHARFFRAVCATFARTSRLQLLALEAQGRTLAMKCNLLAGDGVFCFKIAYDEELAHFSPGMRLELANVEIFQTTQAEWMDSCADPDNRMINRLWPGRRELSTLLIPAQGPLGRVSRHGVRALRTLRQHQRRPQSA